MAQQHQWIVDCLLFNPQKAGW